MKTVITLLLLLPFISFFANASVVNLGAVTSATEQVTQGVNEQIATATARRQKRLAQTALLNQLNEPKELLTPMVASVTMLPDNLDILANDQRVIMTEVIVEDGFRALKQQWLLMLAADELNEVEQLVKQGKLLLLTQKKLPLLGMTLVNIKVPVELDSWHALSILLSPSLQKKLARNHVYSAASLTEQAATLDPVSKVRSAKEHLTKKFKTTAKTTFQGVCANNVRVGMIDTAINLQHPAFAHSDITLKNFVPAEIESPLAHGTAVAALLVSSAEQVPALLPKSKLFAASVFHPQSKFSQGASLFNLINGLEWLLSNQVKIINMSLAGPDNLVLAQAIKQAQKNGAIIVAAAGNDGPSAPALYPAAYPEVIAVTAVDVNKKVYRWANQGTHLTFAALGVNVLTARGQVDFGAETGTSIATPFVTAHVACAKAQYGENYLLQLEKRVEDLGITGRDTVFGYGLLH